MNPGKLEYIIRSLIEKDGPITFEKFMALVLYYPGLGYYMTDDIRIGPDGDYYTSSHLHPIFGWMIAIQLDEMKRILEGTGKFTILELGAGRGFFAENIIDYLEHKLKWSGNWKYVIVEKNPSAIQHQSKLLNRYQGRVSWKTSMDDVDRFCGCVIANELIDAFPVHRIIVTDRFREIYVDMSANGLVDLPGDFSDPALSDYLVQYKIPEIRGYCSEVNLRIGDHLQSLDNIMSEGFELTIDYGYPAWEYYSAQRNKGTLLCYYRHTRNTNPYLHLGDQDITAHVNFTALKDWGEATGLQTLGYCPQGTFLASLGIDKVIAGELESNPSFQTELQKIKGLLFDVGQTHQVMIQYKGNKDIKSLKGFELRNRKNKL